MRAGNFRKNKFMLKSPGLFISLGKKQHDEEL